MRLCGVLALSLVFAPSFPSSAARVLDVLGLHERQYGHMRRDSDLQLRDSLGNTWNINGTGNYIPRGGYGIESACPRESSASTGLNSDVILLQRQDVLDTRFPYAEVSLFSHTSGSPAEFRLWLGSTSTKTRVSLGLHWPVTLDLQRWASAHKDFDFGDRGRRGNSRCGVMIDFSFFSMSVPTDTILENMPIKLSIELVDSTGVFVYNMTGGAETGPVQFGTQTISLSLSTSSTATQGISSSAPGEGAPSGSSGAPVVVIVVPIIATVAIITLLLLWLRRRRQRQLGSTDGNSSITPLPLVRRPPDSNVRLSTDDGGSAGWSVSVREKGAGPSTSAVSLPLTPNGALQDFDASTFIRTESVPPTEYDADDAATERPSEKRSVAPSYPVSLRPPESDTAVNSSTPIRTEMSDVASRITDEDAALQAFRRGELSAELFHAMRRVGFSPETLLQSLNRVGESTTEPSPVPWFTAIESSVGYDDGMSSVAPPRYAGV